MFYPYYVGVPNNVFNFSFISRSPQMFESYENAFCIRCRDVGLICNHIIFAASENGAMENAIVHMFEYHAIISEEMTTCMRLKISQNITKSSVVGWLRHPYLPNPVLILSTENILILSTEKSFDFVYATNQSDFLYFFNIFFNINLARF
jgi:predicted small metal-binding protein